MVNPHRLVVKSQKVFLSIVCLQVADFSYKKRAEWQTQLLIFHL